MTKRKKITISIISIVCLLLIAFFTTWGIYEYVNNKITFVINDTLPDGQGKKAKVILLGGQSNASGCSRDEYLKKNVSAEKYSEYQNGYDNVYINYLSGAKKSESFIKCTTKQGEIEDGFGPELGLAEELHNKHPNELFFIIKYAWGGSNLYKQWLSPSSKGKTGQFYKEFVKYVNTSLEYLISKNYDIEIEGMCWMQGESDSVSYTIATEYKDNLTNFIKDIRKEFSKYKSSDGIAFVDAYIANNPTYWVYYEQINNSKQEVANLSSMNTVIDTIAHDLTCSNEPFDAPDLAHYDSLSEIKLGHLFAEEISKFIN